MRILFFLIVCLSTFAACNMMSPSRRPANYQVTDRPVGNFYIHFNTVKKGLHQIAESSPMIKSFDHISMDSISRRIRIKMTVDYPLESLFTFSDIPDENKSDLHEIDITLGLPDTKSISGTRYLKLDFVSFVIDGDEYIKFFDIILGTVQTLLVNSDLMDYLYTKTEDQLQNPDHRTILREILDNKGIIPLRGQQFPRLGFKIDLAQFQTLSNFIEDYSNLRLWRFSPAVFHKDDERFHVIVGEGKPSEKWLTEQNEQITDDTRTLLQVREDLYQEFSKPENISFIARNYLKETLAAEKINFKKLDQKYQREKDELLASIDNEAAEILARENPNFLADPEFEYIELSKHVENRIRNYVADLDRRLTIAENVLKGGNKNSKAGPIVTKLISEQVLNGTMNFLIDYEYDKVHFVKELKIYMKPDLPGVALYGKINLPLEYLLGQMDSTLQDGKYESKLTEINGGLPVEMVLEKTMKDNGVLGLDIKKLILFPRDKSHEQIFTRNSKNQAFMLDMLKLYVAQLTAAENYELDGEVDADLKRENEIKSIKNYVSEIQKVYQKNQRGNPLFNYFKTDLEYNPFIVAGKDHVLAKKQLMFGDFVSYNKEDKLFDTKAHAALVVDDINNVKLDLQFWDFTPIHSRELNNNFLRLDVGSGLRSNKFINEMRQLRGQAENSDYRGIYYELGQERTPVDLMLSLDFTYLESYANSFLADMVAASSTNIAQQAEAEPGKTFYEVGHVSVDINDNKEMVLNAQIKSAKKSKGFLGMWGQRLKEDTYSISAKLKLSAKQMNIENPNGNLSEIRYFKDVIAINPTEVKIKIGKPTLVDRALTGLLNSATNLAFNNNTVKKLLMKLANKFIKKMYLKRDKDILGHELEKSARVYTTNEELLILLNPRLGGASLDVHLTGKGQNAFEAIKLDPKNKKLHLAFTASVGMAKEDKKNLMNIYAGIDRVIDPLLNMNNKETLAKNLIQAFDKLLWKNELDEKAALVHFNSIMSKYDNVLQTTDLVNMGLGARGLEGTDQNAAERSLKQKISATASELIYFASISDHFEKKLSLLIKKMQEHKLTGKDYYYDKFIEARNKLKNNITKPLIAQYKQRGHIINKSIIKKDISYWTYLFYADAYFAEMTYKELIK